MRVAIFDPYLRKFTGDMERYWLNRGHEVRMDRYYSPELAEWAELIWFDTCDNNLASATNPGAAIMDDSANYQPWDLHKMDLTGKQIIVRPIDIEVWQGHQAAAIWDVVDDVVFIAPHIRELADVGNFPKLTLETEIHTIPCGIDLERYRFAERTHGFDIAVVSEKWTSKGTDLILQIALKLKKIDSRYRIHWLGRWSDHPWEIKYFEDFIAHHGLNFEFTDWIESENAVDDFLEGKNYLLHASHKEGFSYAVAEAMAKGIKPVVHRFYGADDLWPSITWSSVDDAVDMMTAWRDPEARWHTSLHNFAYDSNAYRNYLTDRGYTLPQMMERIERVIQFNN